MWCGVARLVGTSSFVIGCDGANLTGTKMQDRLDCSGVGTVRVCHEQRISLAGEVVGSGEIYFVINDHLPDSE
jgi:hypothetical protein